MAIHRDGPSRWIARDASISHLRHLPEHLEFREGPHLSPKALPMLGGETEHTDLLRIPMSQGMTQNIVNISVRTCNVRP